MTTKKAAKSKRAPRPKTEVEEYKEQEVGLKQWKNPAPNWVKILVAANGGISIAIGAFIVSDPSIERKGLWNLALLIWNYIITATSSVFGIQTKTRRVPKIENT